jgi:heptosyltransferase-2
MSVWGPSKTAILFHHFPRIARVHEVDEKKDPGSLAEIREEGYDRVFLLTNSFSTARTAKELGIPERVGYRTQWRGHLLTRPVWCGPRIRNLRMVDYYLHLLPEDWRKPPVDRQPSLSCSIEELERAQALLAEAVPSQSGKLVGLSPGAAFGPAKQWPISSFARLALTLAGEGHRVFVIGGPSEKEVGDRILEGLPSGTGANLAGATSLREMMAVVSSLDTLVTNDSGPMHIADAVGTPTVALFGSTDSTWTGPHASHHKILQSKVPCNPCFLRECPLDYQCMAELTAERAARATRELLER